MSVECWVYSVRFFYWLLIIPISIDTHKWPQSIRLSRTQGNFGKWSIARLSSEALRSELSSTNEHRAKLPNSCHVKFTPSSFINKQSKLGDAENVVLSYFWKKKLCVEHQFEDCEQRRIESLMKIITKLPIFPSETKNLIPMQC